MNKHKKSTCGQCKEIVDRKHLGKIRGVLLCKKCRLEVRKKHREETIKAEGIKEELEELDKKAKKEYYNSEKSKEYFKKHYHKKHPNARYYNTNPPMIKGSNHRKPRKRNNCYLTSREKQTLFQMLTNKGIDFNEAKERINSLIESQKELRETMKQEGKSEEEIKIQQTKLLEELWNY